MSELFGRAAGSCTRAIRTPCAYTTVILQPAAWKVSQYHTFLEKKTRADARLFLASGSLQRVSAKVQVGARIVRFRTNQQPARIIERHFSDTPTSVKDAGAP